MISTIVNVSNCAQKFALNGRKTGFLPLLQNKTFCPPWLRQAEPGGQPGGRYLLCGAPPAVLEWTQPPSLPDPEEGLMGGRLMEV